MEQDWRRFCILEGPCRQWPHFEYTTTSWWKYKQPTYPCLVEACWELLREAQGGAESGPGACNECCFCMTSVSYGFDAIPHWGLEGIAYNVCMKKLWERHAKGEITCR